MGNLFLVFKDMKIAAIFAMAVATVAAADIAEEGSALWTYNQRVYLRKAAIWFRKADTNHSGLLTWAEYWKAMYWTLRRKGYPHWKIMKYKWWFKKNFMKISHNGLLSWYEVKVWVARHVRE